MMILLVCLGSLGGIFLVPLIRKDSKVGKQTYEYVYAFMIATGASALVSDAILHLIPHVSLYTGIWIVTDCLSWEHFFFQNIYVVRVLYWKKIS